MNYLLIGCGAQGSACALELARQGSTKKIIVVDKDTRSVSSFLQPYFGQKIEFVEMDIKQIEKLIPLTENTDVIISALPYYLNYEITKLAIDCGAHYCDLGGNTDIVDQQKALNKDAIAANVSIVPDCGLAPGLVNILAQAGIDRLDHVSAVKIYVGGLPTQPKPPLNYQIVYSMEGVLDYYTTPVLVLENSQVAEKEPLSGIETLSFDELGQLEAFYTAGGISNLPMLYQGKIAEMSYKTLRYPGHAMLMKSFRELGLFEKTPISIKGSKISPRDAFIASVDPILRQPDSPDLVALRVIVEGVLDTKPQQLVFEMVEYSDVELKISAMMRTTGFSLAAVAIMLATSDIKTGVYIPSECIKLDNFLAILEQCDIHISSSHRVL